MDSIINYWAVISCALVAMVVGAMWYGPLFGRAWLKVIGATASDLAALRHSIFTHLFPGFRFDSLRPARTRRGGERAVDLGWLHYAHHCGNGDVEQ